MPSPTTAAAAGSSAGDRPWQVWVDTGGTFTDCLAVDPAGRIRRAKVLSSGAVRGRVVEVIGGTRLRVERLPGMDAGVLAGMELRRPGGEGGGGPRVVASDATRGILELDGSPRWGVDA